MKKVGSTDKQKNEETKIKEPKLQSFIAEF